MFILFFVTLQIYTISLPKTTNLKKVIGNKLRVLGVMSGTSLDGLDLAMCEFEKDVTDYKFNILLSKTIEYSPDRKNKLANVQHLSSNEYFHFNHLFGKFIAKEINLFLNDFSEKPDAIASHGHTIFHQPHLGFTTQLGCGATIAANTGITTVCDFRSLDVANGGQGAPLVPIGDKLLFGNYDACLNIGGIANISFEKQNNRIAFDVCFANMALNYLAEKLGRAYDENGNFASKGKVNEDLLKQLNETLHSKNKISLAREQFEKLVVPILNKNTFAIEDVLATFCGHVATEISAVLNENKLKNVLVTGGGAYNKFLIDTLKQKFKGEIILPNDQIIQFKEALIFAFLGYLRLQEKTNTLKSVTGAKSDSIAGAVYKMG
jgi:anhydro-N-acetylmuramic acid kinase